MGILSGFPFESRADQDRKTREFNKRIFPFGIDKQREIALNMLNTLIDDKVNKPDTVFFAYLTAKDHYTRNQDEGFNTAAAQHQLDRLIRKNNETKKLILELIKLDTQIESLDDYPTPKRVREAAGLD